MPMLCTIGRICQIVATACIKEALLMTFQTHCSENLEKKADFWLAFDLISVVAIIKFKTIRRSNAVMRLKLQLKCVITNLAMSILS